MDSLLQDLRYAVRSLLARPGFAAVVVLTLALGIGANTAIFSAVNAVLLRPLPVRGLDRIVVIQDELPSLGLNHTPVSPGEALDLSKRTDIFEASGAYTARGMVLTGMGDSRRLAAARTMGRFFDVFGVRPYLGRFYRPDESEEGHHRVAVLSYALWN